MALTSARFASNARLQRAANNNPPLVPGESDHAAVVLIQEALVDLGYRMPRSTRVDGRMDGIYGNETVDVVKQFQRAQHLVDAGGRADGIAGRDTLQRLDAVAPRELINRTISYDVPLIAQPNATSCWAASMAMLVSYSLRRTVAPQEIADSVGLNFDSSYGWEVLRNSRAYWHLREIPRTPPISDFPQLLLQHGPLWMVVTGNLTHAIVLTGTDGRRYSWNDPWPPGPNGGRRTVLAGASAIAQSFGGAAGFIGRENCQLLYRES